MLSGEEKRESEEEEREEDLEWVETGESVVDLSMEEREPAEGGD